MPLTLSRSYAVCERLARQQAGNFYHAFRVLPAPQRRAMCALYAFLRVTDDLSDGPGSTEEKRDRLQSWRQQFEEALAGRYRQALHPAFHHMLQVFAVPRAYVDAVLDGVEMDLGTVRYETFADLYPYCYRVASAVGLACIHIWGCTDEAARVHAEKAGIAFQLTNILRDLGEDAARGRVYVPRAELEQFGYGVDALVRGERTDLFRALMRFQVERARNYYDAAWPLWGMLPPAGRAVFQVMMHTYQGLLDAIEHRAYDVFSSRVTVSAWRKLGFTVQALPVRFGFLNALLG